MNNSRDVKFAVSVAEEAGTILMSFYGKKLTKKIKSGPDDFATEADLAAEEFILSRITSQYPGDAIVAEESGKHTQENAEYTWIVDPLDGTHNFAQNKEGFGVLIARARGHKIELAVAYDPARNLFAKAELGQGTYFNEKKVILNPAANADLPISANSELHDQLKTVGIGATDHSAIGSALNTLSGKRKAYAANSGFVWDFAVPALLFKEAGWIVTDMQGHEFRYDEKIQYGWPGIIAAPSKLHENILELLK